LSSQMTNIPLEENEYELVGKFSYEFFVLFAQ
jgi:hypothetical protein